MTYVGSDKDISMNTPPVDDDILRKIKKGVHFKSTVRIILVPCRIEYIAAGLIPVLWWEKNDFILFKCSAVEELASLTKLSRTPSSEETTNHANIVEKKLRHGNDQNISFHRNDLITDEQKKSRDSLDKPKHTHVKDKKSRDKLNEVIDNNGDVADRLHIKDMMKTLNRYYSGTFELTSWD